MEGQVWGKVEELLSFVDSRPPRCRFHDGEILRVILWAVLQDRPIVWACFAMNWQDACRPEVLPDPSTVSRRWRRPGMQEKADALHEESVRRLGVVSRYAAIDGRALPVGGCRKDPDARSGRSAGGLGKGYKMHALVSVRHVILAYVIRPMNEAEPTVALELLAKAPAGVTRIVGDGAYDSVRLLQTAKAAGRKFYAPLRQGRVGRRKQPLRVHLLRLLQRVPGRRLLKSRDEIERTFGQTSTISFGFKGLPAWSRRNHRVLRSMWGKNLTYHAWLLTKKPAA